MNIVWEKKPGKYPVWEANFPSISLRATVSDITCDDYEIKVHLLGHDAQEQGLGYEPGLQTAVTLQHACSVTPARALEIASKEVEEFIAGARLSLA
jgi:hypothetical protein